MPAHAQEAALQPAFALIRVCKVAGPGVPIGTFFPFSARVDAAPVPIDFTLLAGSGPIGNCTSLGPITGMAIRIVELPPAGVMASTITVVPTTAIVVPPDPASGSVTVRALTTGTPPQVTVTFTNTREAVDEARTCRWQNDRYSPGAVVRQNDALLYQCTLRGTWQQCAPVVGGQRCAADAPDGGPPPPGSSPPPGSIRQLNYNASAHLGDRFDGENISQGQSFLLDAPGRVQSFSVLLGIGGASNVPGSAQDRIDCVLMDAAQQVVVGGSVPGFDGSPNDPPRWITCPFATQPMLPPGTYIAGVSVLTGGAFGYYANTDDASYPAGTRYSKERTGPWFANAWDSAFVITLVGD